jgi:hypothetical protein
MSVAVSTVVLIGTSVVGAGGCDDLPCIGDLTDTTPACRAEQRRHQIDATARRQQFRYVPDSDAGEDTKRTHQTRNVRRLATHRARQACGDAVSRVYPHRFEFSGGKIVQVMFDVADEPYADVETRLAALMARD